MTFQGTNTYIVGTGDVAVIDPGPDLPDHLEAILSALEPGERVSHIFVTHSHLDHSPLAAALCERTGARVFAFGAAQDGRSAGMQALADQGLVGGGEGVDLAFRSQVRLRDGETITHGDWQIEAVHTPGHMANHLCFAWAGHLFSGDHVMGWASSLVSPPDGDMAQYMASLDKLMRREWGMFFPGHGAEVTFPALRLRDLHSHRRSREAAILQELRQGPASVCEIARHLYHDVPPALLPAAKRNVLAHLIDLHNRNEVSAHPAPGPHALFQSR
tara:strand:- start:796 stop:1614 length:819 start_codon:yes stop_codon:yes gene_type:complete